VKFPLALAPSKGFHSANRDRSSSGERTRLALARASSRSRTFLSGILPLRAV